MPVPVAPELTAKLSLFPSYEGGGGAAKPRGDFRTILGLGEESFSARVEALEGQRFEPGATIDATIQFLAPEAALPKFRPGTRFTIWEGKAIGLGEVVGLLSPPNKSLERTRDR